MMIRQFKKEDGFGVGYKYSQADFEGVLDKLLGKLTPEERFPKTHNTKGFKPDQPKDGVFQEPPKKPPVKPVWTPKPKDLKNSLDSLPGTSKAKPKAGPKATKPKPPPQAPKPQPKPKRWPETFVCDYCHRQGHLEEFCFRRKRAERLERSWRNKDQFHQEGSRPFVPRRAVWSDDRARRVGGGGGDDFGRRAPVGGGFPQAPGRRFGYDFGPPSSEFERARFERDPRFGSSAPAFHPTYEQMARHWFSTHPSVGPFAHPFDR